jgi:hypothetical protein
VQAALQRSGTDAETRVNGGRRRSLRRYQRRLPRLSARYAAAIRRFARGIGYSRRRGFYFLGRTNPRRFGGRKTMWPKEPKAMQPDLRDGRQTNPSRFAEPGTIRPNEPKPAHPAVYDLGQTNPTRSCYNVTMSPNEPEAVEPAEHGLARTNPRSSCEAANIVMAERTQAIGGSGNGASLAKRTQAGVPRRDGLKRRPYMRAGTILAKRTRAAESCRKVAQERAPHPEVRVPHLGRAPRRIARVSKDGHHRDRARGPPSRGRFAPPHRMRPVGLSFFRPIRIGSWYR